MDDLHTHCRMTGNRRTDEAGSACPVFASSAVRRGSSRLNGLVVGGSPWHRVSCWTLRRKPTNCRELARHVITGSGAWMGDNDGTGQQWRGESGRLASETGLAGRFQAGLQGQRHALSASLESEPVLRGRVGGRQPPDHVQAAGGTVPRGITGEKKTSRVPVDFVQAVRKRAADCGSSTRPWPW